MTDADRIPPHSDEAEVAVLGSIILLDEGTRAGDDKRRAAVLALLGPADFYRDPHVVIFATMTRLAAAAPGLSLDITVLCNELQRAGHLERVGGSAILQRLVASVPSTANAEFYARIVRTKALEREVWNSERVYTDASAGGDGSEAFGRLVAARAALEDFTSLSTSTAVASSWDFADLLQEPDDPPPDEFVSRLFVRPSFNIVFGPPQAGKSWAVMALCLDAVLGGGNFLGCGDLYIKPLRELRDGRPDRVLWVFGHEDTRARVKGRLKNLLQTGPHAGKDVPALAFTAATPPGGMSIHLEQGWKWLLKKVEETGATIVVLDTIASLTGNSLDVNKAEQVIPFISRVNELRSSKNIIIFALHHTRKSSTDSKRTDGSKADAMLGCGAWRSLTEGVLMLDAVDGDTTKVTAVSIKAKDIDSPIPHLNLTLERPSGRFRQLLEEEEPIPREPVKPTGRPTKFSAEAVLALRPRFPDGLPWNEKTVTEMLDVSRGVWFDRKGVVYDDLMRADCIIIGGILKWPAAAPESPPVDDTGL